MNVNTTLDLNTILSAAVVTIVERATSTLAARVDELERNAAKQADMIEALSRALRAAEEAIVTTPTAANVMPAVDGGLTGAALAEHDKRIRDIERTLYGVDATGATSHGGITRDAEHLMTRVESLVVTGLDELRAELRDKIVDEREVENMIENAIDEHCRDSEHNSEDDIDRILENSGLVHEDDLPEALDEDQIKALINQSIDDATFGLRNTLRDAASALAANL